MTSPTVLRNDLPVAPLTPDEMRWWRLPAAEQQPEWADAGAAAAATATLRGRPPLIAVHEVDALRDLIAEAAAGHRMVLQAGDCAEDLRRYDAGALGAAVGLVERLGDELGSVSGLPVLRVGRIAGQFAKPRSAATEDHGGLRLPVYRGPLVNGPGPTRRERRHTAERLSACHDAARFALAVTTGRVWTSHEALVRDYELPQIRRAADGRLVLTSTHWPWIGYRTLAPQGFHVRLLAAVSNPIAVKVGPGMSAGALRNLCELLDPDRAPGRLTLIARFGAGRAAAQLPALVAAIAAAGHPVAWLCDPMHGNTETAPDGRKTRSVSVLLREVAEFRSAVHAGGGVAAGLHLETTAEAVGECLWTPGAARTGPYTSLCDPRLNPEQALAVVRGWRAERAG